MMKTILCVVLLLLTNLGISQTMFKRGIYRSFDEFKLNEPGDSLAHEVESTFRYFYKAGAGLASKGEEATYYHLTIKKKEAKEIGDIIGFSDGKWLYMSTKKVNPSNKNSLFSKAYRMNDSLYVFKHYSTELNFGLTYNSGQGGVVPTPTTNRVQAQYSLNINGSIKELTIPYLNDLLKTDPILLEKFNNEEDKKGLLLFYYSKLFDDGKY